MIGRTVRLVAMAVGVFGVLAAIIVFGPSDAAADVCAGTECDTVGFVDDASRFFVFEDLLGETDVAAFYFGDPGDVPLSGDWDCDGEQTPAQYRRSTGFAYLRNSNSQGVADSSFYLGDPGDVPIAGDFDGDGCDSIGVYRPSEARVFVKNSLGPGTAEFSYAFGNPGDVPFVGDFDGDGVDTVGLHRPSTGLVYFRNSHSAGPADWDFIFGDPNDRIIAGDWNGDGRSTVAAYRPSTGRLYVTNRHGAGVADHDMVVGRFRHAVRLAGIDDLPEELLVPAPATAPMPVGVSGSWDLVFEDQFDSFDDSVWRTRYQWTPVVINGELQAYRPEAVTVHDGHLRLTASATPTDGQPYTSGVITSYGKFSFLYGTVEFRARAPVGRGLLSALWLLPDNHDYPPEIDVIEVNGAQPNLGHIGYHWADGADVASEMWTGDFGDLTDGFHTYAVRWEPGVVAWYVDGVEVHRFEGSTVASQEMYLLANLAVGGWVGAPDGSTPLPASLVLDYIRVWQRS